MANIKSAAKRARQSERLHLRNSSVLSALKSGQKKVRTSVAAGNLDEAKAEYQKITAALDKAAKRGMIHRNSANRRKSVLNRAIAPVKA